jgi:hypothetical protein
MKKMQEKSKIYNIQGKSTNSPSNQAIRMANTNFPRKSANREESRGLVKMSANCATEDYFREDQQMREDSRKWQVPEVLF